MHDPNRAKAASPNEVFPGEYAPRGSAEAPRRVEVRGEGAHVTIRRGRSARQIESDRAGRGRGISGFRATARMLR